MSGTVDPFSPVTLSHPSTPVSISILPYGLTVHSIIVAADDDAGGATRKKTGLKETHDLVPNYEDPKNHGYPNRAFFTPIIGRYANRLPVGKLPYKGKDGKVQGYVQTEEFNGPGVSMHGGPYPSSTSKAPGIPQVPVGKVTEQAGPFDRLVWTPIDRASSRLFSNSTDAASSTIHEETLAEQVFAVESPHGDQGFPGKLLIEVLLALGKGGDAKSAAGSIRLQYKAKLLGEGQEATPLNLTQHWGFNLSASSLLPEALKEGGQIDQHFMRFLAPASSSAGASPVKLLDLDENAVPTGKLLPIAKDSEHDFCLNGGKKLGTSPPDGFYDRYYHWGGVSPTASEDLLKEPRIELSSSTTGLRLLFRTNQSGVQCYTTNFQPPYPAPPSETGGARKLLHRPTRQQENDGKGYGNHQRSSVMLEFGSPHATFLHDELIKANGGVDTVLHAGGVYDHLVIMEVHVDSTSS